MTTEPTPEQLAAYANAVGHLFGLVKDGKLGIDYVTAALLRLATTNSPAEICFDHYASLLISPIDWLAKLRAYNSKYWGNYLSEQDFAQAEAQLALVPDGHIQSVDNVFGFHVAFASLKQTYDMWGRVYQGELLDAWRMPELKVDAEHLALHELAHSYDPGIHLVAIDLVANWETQNGRSLLEVRQQAKSRGETLAQLEVISFYGVLIQLLSAQDGENFPYVDMAGTIVTVPGSSKSQAMGVGRRRFDRRYSLYPYLIGETSRCFSAPLVRRLQH